MLLYIYMHICIVADTAAASTVSSSLHRTECSAADPTNFSGKQKSPTKLSAWEGHRTLACMHLIIWLAIAL